MKKFLIIFGSFILFIVSTGTMFKLMHWPGAGPLLVIGIFLFSVFFLPIFFILRMVENKSALNIITNIFGLFTTSSLFMGVLFKIMHWPGAGPMIVLGTTFFICPTLILYVIQQFKEYNRNFREFWRTVVLGVLVSVFLIFWGTNVTRNILYSYLKIEDATLQTNLNLTEYNSFILDEIKQKHPDDSVYVVTAEEIHKLTTEMVQKIENIKKELIQSVELNPEAMDNHWLINAKDNYDISTHYLGTAESQAGIELFNNLNALKTELKKQMEKLPLANKATIEGLGDFGIKTELNPAMADYEMEWNQEMFHSQIVVGALSLLTGLQNEVLNAEFKCLKVISLDARKFNLTIRLETSGNKALTMGTIKIIKNGKTEMTIDAKGIEESVALNFNSNYLIECSKNGYQDKTFFFDTHIPDGREKEEFAKFTASVELNKNEEGKIAETSKPVGGVKYDTKLEDFNKVGD
jgi:hypothetical protein